MIADCPLPQPLSRKRERGAGGADLYFHSRIHTLPLVGEG